VEKDMAVAHLPRNIATSTVHISCTLETYLRLEIEGGQGRQRFPCVCYNKQINLSRVVVVKPSVDTYLSHERTEKA
jgi:hypothetical protein